MGSKDLDLCRLIIEVKTILTHRDKNGLKILDL